MLIATLTTLLLLSLGLGGAKLDNVFVDIKKPVKQTVTDSERRDQILDVRAELEKTLNTSRKAWKKQVAAFLDVQDDYSSTEADFDDQQAGLGELLAADHLAVLDARDSMKTLMTREEWEQVFAGDR
jgi:hypothetical protein